MRKRYVTQRRKAAWDFSGATAYNSGFVFGSVAYPVFWVRVPAGREDSAYNRVVPDDCTLIRSIYQFSWFFEANATLASVAQMTFGVCVFKWFDDTLPAAVPDPTTDADLDWIWRFQIAPTGQPVNGTTYFGQATADTHISVKARRKLSAGDGLLFVQGSALVANGSLPTGELGFNFDVRNQLLLP